MYPKPESHFWKSYMHKTSEKPFFLNLHVSASYFAENQSYSITTGVQN